MKSLNKIETPIFLSVVCSLFPKAIFLMFVFLLSLYYDIEITYLSKTMDPAVRSTKKPSDEDSRTLPPFVMPRTVV